MAPETCPNCGAEVPANARACPECGSCEETGWSQQAASDHLGLPDDSFSYQDFVKREFGPNQSRPRGISTFWWVVAIVVTLALIVLFI